MAITSDQVLVLTCGASSLLFTSFGLNSVLKSFSVLEALGIVGILPVLGARKSRTRWMIRLGKTLISLRPGWLEIVPIL
jgi:hypothetical protein